MVVLNIDVKKINLDNNFDENDPETITFIRPLANSKNAMHLKKS